jgi:hypothetical protein
LTMKAVLRFVFWLIICELVVIVQFFIIDFFPYPFNLINFIFVFLFLLFIFTTVVKTIWLIIPISLILESFSSSFFAAGSLAFFFSLLIVGFLLFKFFTSHSGFVVLLSSTLGMILFHVFYFLFSNAINVAQKKDFLWPVGDFFKESAWEISFTSLFITTIYVLLLKFNRRFNPSYIYKNEKK